MSYFKQMKYINIKTATVLLFVLSGMCSLIYEVAWAKYLALLIGHSGYSHMIVLATFMGGLALGTFFWGKYSDKVANHLQLYGIIEIAIGVYWLILLSSDLQETFLFTRHPLSVDLVTRQYSRRLSLF